MYHQSNDSNMNMRRKIREVARTYYKLYRTPESGVEDCNNKEAHDVPAASTHVKHMFR